MKNQYHSDFIIQYKLGLLPKNIVKKIPPATTHYWRNTPNNNFFAPDVLNAQEQNMTMIKEFLSRKELLRAAKAMYHIFLQIQEITHHSKQWDKWMFNNKELIVQTIEKQKHVLGLKRSLRIFNITSHQFYAWKNTGKCHASVFKQCVKRYPRQLNNKSIQVIRAYLSNNEFQHWSVASVYYKMIRDKAAEMSLSTFYRYTRKLGISRKPLKKKPYPQGIRASEPKQLFHIDVTILKLPNNVKAYIYVLMDNHSRFILNAQASLEYKAIHTFNNLKLGFEKHHIKNTFFNMELLCDGGSENKGVVNDLLAEYTIKKLLAQKDVHFSNSMVEALNKRIKYDFLFRQYFENIESLQAYMPILIKAYNSKPHTSLFGFTPKEVFSGIEASRSNFLSYFEIQKGASTTKKHETCSVCI